MRWLYGEQYAAYTDRELAHAFHHTARVTGEQRHVAAELVRRGYDPNRSTEDQLLGAIELRRLRQYRG